MPHAATGTEAHPRARRVAIGFALAAIGAVAIPWAWGEAIDGDWASASTTAVNANYLLAGFGVLAGVVAFGAAVAARAKALAAGTFLLAVFAAAAGLTAVVAIDFARTPWSF